MSTSTQPPPEAAQPDRAMLEAMASIGDEVDRFCDGHDLRAHAITALRLARDIFPAIESLTIHLRSDPEEESMWLLVVVETKAPPAEAADAYRRLIREWVRSCPPKQRALIRMSYRVL